MKKLILASGSPRRRELLAQIGLEFEVIVSDAEEIMTSTQPGEVVKEFADRPFELEGFEMQINRLRKLGRYHLYDPISPIFIFTAIKH